MMNNEIFSFKLMTKEISAGIEGDTELGDQVSDHSVQYLSLDHRDTKCLYR